jgi:hypothetical protein
MPARIIFSSISGESEAGPMVHTSFVLLAESFMEFSPEIPPNPFEKGGLEEVVRYYLS